jgi:hypothetical protein
MNGAVGDFVAVVEGRDPSKEEHSNSELFLHEVGLLSKELRGIIPAAEKTRKRTASQIEAGSDSDNDSEEEETPQARVIISIDEADVLAEPSLPSFARHTALQVFARVISHLVLHPVAFTAISTNVGLGILALATSSARNIHPSTDETDETEDVVLPVPFTELPFDMFAFDDEADGIACVDLTLEDVSEIDFFVKFGRPL